MSVGEHRLWVHGCAIGAVAKKSEIQPVADMKPFYPNAGGRGVPGLHLMRWALPGSNRGKRTSLETILEFEVVKYGNGSEAQALRFV